MDLKDRFFGKGTPKLGEPPVANPRLAEPPKFTLLFAEVPRIDTDYLSHILRDYHSDFAGVSVEFAKDTASTIGLVGWGRHVVKVVVFDKPAAEDVVRDCVQPTLYDAALKQEAFRHAAHALLFYAGYEQDILEQHVALAAVAAGLTHFGGLVVLNERGQTSLPALELLPHEEDKGDTLRSLRNFPLPLLYVGFVMAEVEDEPGVWMRTHGCSAFKLPDLALQAGAHNQGSAALNLFANLLAHMREQGKVFQPGDTLNVGEGMAIQIRDRTKDEWFLQSDGTMLVLEPITEAEDKR